ncbi:MAG: peptidylprolyl isomerase [Arcobacteraceae bacterium]|jgi:hypothetical protein|nr:peptidylprolyl isomerase [Arcobacteraceae bacterium]
MKKNFSNLSLLAASLLLTSNLLAEDITVNQAEVASYAIQKHRVDFNAQTDKSKADIIKEYSQSAKLANSALVDLKDDVDFKVATQIVALEIWAQKFMVTINPSDDELKKLYATEKPKVNARVNLRNILLKDETTADKLLKTLNTIKDKTKKLEKFKELVKSESLDITTKSKEGAIGFVDEGKLDKSIQELLKGKTSNDIVKFNIPNMGWQLFFVEEYQPSRDATLEEAKQFLVNALRQKALGEQIDKRLQTK